MGATATKTLISLITAGQLHDAVVLALSHPVRWVADQLSYEEIDEAAGRVRDLNAGEERRAVGV